MKPAWSRAAEYAGLQLGEDQTEQMRQFGSWLGTEGHRAGGIGPAEPVRIDRRHLADSLLFATQIPKTIDEVWDLGSGVGLPGIPLAIAMPEVRFRLFDRSGKRVDLMRRAVRVLGMRNCSVVQGEIGELEGKSGTIVSRASLPPEEMTEVMRQHLTPDGVGILAGSWLEEPLVPGWTAIEIPRYVLDQAVWLLIMRRE